MLALRPLVVFGLLAMLASVLPAQHGGVSGDQLYKVRQRTLLQAIPDGAETVKWWIAIPNDDRHQDVLDIQVVSAPGTYEICRDLDRGQRFLFVEAHDPKAKELEVVLEFSLRRDAVGVDLTKRRGTIIDDSHRRLLAAELAKDAPHMEVTPEVQRAADGACGDEKDVVKQATLLLAHVAQTADHYSKDPSKPHCGIGDAGDCLTNGGGCCTDLHSLFIALARARGIPARLQMGYRLLEKNVGKEVDPGYRCWAEYFVPGAGWVPADIVEADATGGLGPTVWFHGLTTRRLWLNQGRDFRFANTHEKGPITTMVIGYAEIDGKPVRVRPEGDLPAQMSRRVLFTEITEAATQLEHTAKTNR